MPKIVRKNKEALSKEDVVDILNACSDIRLKTYVMFLAAGGFRAVEALSVRVKDLDLESKPAHVFVRGEFTKTRVDRIMFLTDEITQQLNILAVVLTIPSITPSSDIIKFIELAFDFTFLKKIF